MDLYEALREARTTPDPEPSVLEHARRQLVAESRRARRYRSYRGARRWVASLTGVTLLAGGGAAAWAITRGDPQTGTTIECGPSTFIPVQSGNPVLDCRNALAHLESTVPRLAGWITPTGLVAVLPWGQRPPAGSRPLPANFEVSRSILFVGDVLNDEAQPTVSDCTTASSAVAFAYAQLRVAGLGGWTVQVRAEQSSGVGCTGYTGYLDPSTATAFLVPVSLSTAARPGVDVRLDGLLRAQLVSGPSARCDTSAQAATLVTEDAVGLGLAPSQLSVSVAGAVASTSPTCAIVTIDPGGSIEAVVWQVPASSRAG
ncbi:MAG TPA: hypothetical protein VGZ03_01530 [Acidimicrobiales bacterium]|jgi:hypothetical protein|nr:hypothetical protein [Acidimicrobiales bacterium]